MVLLYSAEKNILVPDLEPNTRYEFAVRLHLDQLSSPWSPVVYQSTLPEGEHQHGFIQQHMLYRLIEYTLNLFGLRWYFLAYRNRILTGIIVPVLKLLISPGLSQSRIHKALHSANK